MQFIFDCWIWNERYILDDDSIQMENDIYWILSIEFEA